MGWWIGCFKEALLWACVADKFVLEVEDDCGCNLGLVPNRLGGVDWDMETGLVCMFWL